jgi:hypothetical protein
MESRSNNSNEVKMIILELMRRLKIAINRKDEILAFYEHTNNLILQAELEALYHRIKELHTQLDQVKFIEIERGAA